MSHAASTWTIAQTGGSWLDTLEPSWAGGVRNYSSVVAGNLTRWVGELRVTEMVFSVAGLAVAGGGVANDKTSVATFGRQVAYNMSFESE